MIAALFGFWQMPAPVPAQTKQVASAPPANTAAMEESLRKQRESLQLQINAIHQQATGLGITPSFNESLALSPAALEMNPARSSPCPSISARQADDLAAAAARTYSIDASLIKAVMRRESNLDPCAISPKGALGLMQLMPDTARALRVNDVFNPKENVFGGAAYLKQLLKRYEGNLKLALVGYNAGPGRADDLSGRPYPAETQTYIGRILSDLGLTPPVSEEAVQQEQQASPLPEEEAETHPESVLGGDNDSPPPSDESPRY